MLKFIVRNHDNATFEREFQNILCWSLSEPDKFNLRELRHFKTSYVEVYLGLWEGDEFGGFISKHLMLKFILRQPVQVSRSAKISKHLMLKFINTKTEKLLLHLHFKTSYVEVYPGQWMDWGRKEKIISKHLMLKFIIWGKKGRWETKTISKHLMLKFIGIVLSRLSRSTMISKHLMLKFIDWKDIKNIRATYFKTSYVEVYPTFSRYFYLLLSIFPFIFPDFYHFYQASAHILFPIQYLTNSPTLQYFLNIFLFFAW